VKARTGILLAAHGSRHDPIANQRVRELAAELLARGAADEVVAGFHQGTPGFSAALDSLRAERVLVVPLFTSEGYYTDEVLPTAIRASLHARQVRQAAPFGVHPGLPALVAAQIRARIASDRLNPQRTSVLLVGHGTPRNPASRRATLRLAEALREETVAEEVACGFLDDTPRIEAALAMLRHPSVLVVPFLIGGGDHALKDLPRRAAGDAGRCVLIDLPVGGYDGVVELLLDLARRELPAAGEPAQLPAGTVALVGAGPGDPSLITVKGLALLRAADVVLHDRLAAPELLTEVRRDALVVDVGKLPGGGGTSQESINALLVEYALAGRRVVRLKGGDPFVFGRGSEELDACAAFDIPCTVVPGISSAIGVPAAAGIPVTGRGESRSFAVITAHSDTGERPDAVRQLGANAEIETLVLLMGRAVLRELATELIAAGRDPETPVACIQEGTTPRQRVTTGTLATIADAADRDGLAAPIVIVVGAVAARAAGVVPVC
jgi:uroporphyrin-III C-methyltransferase/precorrin-2 dehydrogenase/sirohydrochlorin ferrochelatase